MNRLEGKTALITGAARGLGAQIAERFAGEGAEVIINDLSQAAADATAERLGGRAVAADVSDSASVAAMFEAVAGMTDRLDILVNNAGISGMEGDNDARERIRVRAAALASGSEPPPESESGILDSTRVVNLAQTNQYLNLCLVRLGDFDQLAAQLEKTLRNLRKQSPSVWIRQTFLRIARELSQNLEFHSGLLLHLANNFDRIEKLEDELRK